MQKMISVRGAREHNLKNVNVDIPRDQAILNTLTLPAGADEDLPGMVERKAGRIALVGSIAGRIGGVASAPHYLMSKGGVHSFVRWAAKRGAPHNVTVNAVAPGVVDTPMTANQSFNYDQFPMGRKASAREMAAPLAFLVSPAAAYVNGAVLDVNSGMHFS